MALLIGTSGWQYDDWGKGGFYPDGLAKSRWLDYYAATFRTVESNNAFYRLPEKSLFERWAERTPPDFVMAVKASRYLTHVRRLTEPKEPVHRLMERIAGLGSKAGPVLVQLPPNLRCDVDKLDATLRAFPKTQRVAVELRHESWFTDATRSVLESRGAALCLADRRGPSSPLWRTASWGYVRLHEGRSKPAPSYGRTSLETWAKRIGSLWSATDDVFCYFNNDTNARAPHDAEVLARIGGRHGLDPTRARPPEGLDA